MQVGPVELGLPSTWLYVANYCSIFLVNNPDLMPLLISLCMSTDSSDTVDKQMLFMNSSSSACFMS